MRQLHLAYLLKSQMEWRHIAAGLVQHGLCGGFAPHEFFALADKALFFKEVV
jgi:hypothetical protein